LRRARNDKVFFASMTNPTRAARLALWLSLLLPFASIGATPAPTFRLGDNVAPTSYALRLAIDPRGDTFGGAVRIEVRVKEAAPVIWLHAEELDSLEATFTQDGKSVAAEVTRASDQIVGLAPQGGAAPGDATLEIRFQGAIEPKDTRGLFRQRVGDDWYAMTQFEAVSARRAFPCFDEPGWKTPWQVTIDAPDGDRVVSNTPEEGAQAAPDRAGWTRHVFARTKPLPTYLVAYGVGPFDFVAGGTAGQQKTPLGYVAPRGRGAETRFAKESTPQLLEHLEAYFGRPYPYEKLDSATIPATVGFGAMENVGMITYSSELMLARPRDESLAFRRAWASVASHEMAHQWFGDLVTTTWWNDIWLNEAFATWMARKNLAAWKPEWQEGWRSGEGRRRALHADRLMSARRVANPVDSIDDIYSAFDGITYSKGAEVLAMFESAVGPERFQAGVRKYLADHAYGSATSDDFFQAIADATEAPGQIVEGFRSFIDQAGLPLIEVRLRCREGAPPRLEVRPHRFVSKGRKDTGNARWLTPACFRYGVKGEMHKQCAEIRGRQSVVLDTPQCPDWVTGNADGAGHWVARLEESTQQGRLSHLRELPEREAIAVGDDAKVLLQSGLMTPADAIATARELSLHRSPGTRHAAVEILDALRDGMMDVEERRAFDRLVAERIVPSALKLGWTPRAGESLDQQELRAVLLPYAARMPVGSRLRSEARVLALRWLDDPAGIDASVIEPVLQTAGRFADAALFDRLQQALATHHDKRERSHILGALAAVSAPALRDRAYAVALREESGDAAFDGRDAMTFFEKALEDKGNRSAAFAFARTHWAELHRKWPSDSEAWLLQPMGELCTAEERREFAGYFAQASQSMHGGDRAYAQALESIDICVATLVMPAQAGIR
jgi:alanyl aminopeptidase